MAKILRRTRLITAQPWAKFLGSPNSQRIGLCRQVFSKSQITKRASVGLAICLAGLLGAGQSDGVSADSRLQSWMRQFNATYMVGMATYQAKFQANPSFDKGLIIVVPVKFDKMVAENVAIFRGGVLHGVGDNSPNAQMVVSNMPAEQFTAGESVVLAFKILGASSEYGLPHGEFVAAHHCTRPDCLDFIG